MTLNKAILYLVFCVFPLGICGQNNYFLTDSISAFGDNIIDSGDILNSQFCTVENVDEIIRYTPDKVKEYGLNDGRVYVSKTIFANDTLRKVFMLRLVTGKLTLYYYRSKTSSTFYWEKDSTKFYELPRFHKNHPEISFRKDLEYLTDDCENAKYATRLANYNKESLTELITNYNCCKFKIFQHFRYGFLFGAGINKLDASSSKSNSTNGINFGFESEFSPGFFIDYPIEMSNFSLHTDFYFTKSGYSYNSNYDDIGNSKKNIAFLANTTSINIPILIRYTLPNVNFRPFLNAGLLYAYNFKNNTSIYTSMIYPTYIVSSEIDKTSHISKKELGLSAGTGIECILNYKHSLFFELRYNKLLGWPNEYNLTKSSIQIVVSVNL